MLKITKTGRKSAFGPILTRVFVFVVSLTWLAGCVMPVNKPLKTPAPGELPQVAPSATFLPSSTPLVDETATPEVTVTPAPVAPRSKYSLKVRFDYARHQLAVDETITYYNHTPADIPNLVLVVEPNRSQGVFKLEFTHLGGWNVRLGPGFERRQPDGCAAAPSGAGNQRHFDLDLPAQSSPTHRHPRLG